MIAHKTTCILKTRELRSRWVKGRQYRMEMIIMILMFTVRRVGKESQNMEVKRKNQKQFTLMCFLKMKKS
jgi:hypothetical protein